MTTCAHRNFNKIGFPGLRVCLDGREKQISLILFADEGNAEIVFLYIKFNV